MCEPLPSPAGRGLGLGIPGLPTPHTVAGPSRSGALPLRVPEPGPGALRPSRRSARGPPAAAAAARSAPQTPRDLPLGGSAPARGSVLPPARAGLLSGEPRFPVSLRGPARARQGLVQSLPGRCSGAGRSACGCGGQISSLFPGLFPWRSEELSDKKHTHRELVCSEQIKGGGRRRVLSVI